MDHFEEYMWEDIEDPQTVYYSDIYSPNEFGFVYDQKFIDTLMFIDMLPDSDNG